MSQKIGVSEPVIPGFTLEMGVELKANPKKMVNTLNSKKYDTTKKDINSSYKPSAGFRVPFYE